MILSSVGNSLLTRRWRESDSPGGCCEAMTDFTPFEDLLAGHAGLLEDSVHDRWVRAQALFEERAYREAALLLRELIDGPEVEEIGHGLTEARLLLARSYFHAALLNPAIEAAQEVLANDPHEPYAHLLIGRSLERQSKRDEAAPHLKLANLLGGYAA
jgi:tetratricopeptide (TPR) repeat protein